MQSTFKMQTELPFEKQMNHKEVIMKRNRQEKRRGRQTAYRIRSRSEWDLQVI